MSERSTLSKLLSIHFTQSPQNFSMTTLDVFCSGGKEGLSICPRLWRQSEEELKSLLMKVKEESEKVGLSSTFRKLRSWHPVPSLHGKKMGKQWKQCQTLFLGPPKSLQMVIAAMKLKDTYSLEGKLGPT